MDEVAKERSNEWNRLGNHFVSAQTMGSFKRRSDEFMDEDDRWK